MQVVYKNQRLRKICEDAEVATKMYGERMAELIHRRIDELSAADTVEMLVKFRVGRCHPLQGDRKGQYAMDLVHPQRLIFDVRDYQTIEVRIIDIMDYH